MLFVKAVHFKRLHVQSACSPTTKPTAETEHVDSASILNFRRKDPLIALTEWRWPLRVHLSSRRCATWEYETMRPTCIVRYPIFRCLSNSLPQLNSTKNRFKRPQRTMIYFLAKYAAFLNNKSISI